MENYIKISKKIVILGQSAVGKTSLVLKLLSGKFNPYSESTIGASFCSKLIKADDGIVDKVEIWDTAGQERYRSLVPMYYRNAGGALIVFDITSKKSFEEAKFWMDELKAKVMHDIKILFVGNKLDLEKEAFENYKEECNRLFGTNYVLVSAKTGENVENAFTRLVSEISRVRKEEEYYPMIDNHTSKSCC